MLRPMILKYSVDTLHSGNDGQIAEKDQEPQRAFKKIQGQRGLCHLPKEPRCPCRNHHKETHGQKEGNGHRPQKFPIGKGILFFPGHLRRISQRLHAQRQGFPQHHDAPQKRLFQKRIAFGDGRHCPGVHDDPPRRLPHRCRYLTRAAHHHTLNDRLPAYQQCICCQRKFLLIFASINAQKQMKQGIFCPAPAL